MVADYFCSSCGTPFLSASPLDANGRCSLCRHGLTRFDAAFSYGEYEGTLRRLVHLYKYGRVRPLELPLGRLLVRAIPRAQRFDLVVPVPLHWRRRLTRGFNQSELLARHAARHLHAPLHCGLSRTRSTGAQAGLTNAQRRENVAAAFRITDQNAIRDRHVLLVDDVLTTGATLNAAAGALKRAGARRVSIVTVARADRRKPAFTAWQLDSSSSNSRELSE